MNKIFPLLLALVLGSAPLFAQPVITNQPVNQTVVWGGNATFSVMATGIGPLTYQWQLNGTNLPNNIISTVAGGNLFNNQPATNTILAIPSGTASDSAGNLFIADGDNNVIRKVGTNGVAIIVAGNGSVSSSGDGGAAANAGLSLPSAVCLDSVGNLLIADSSNNRIRKVDTNGIISTVAGTGTSGFFGDNGAATTAQLSNPETVCADAKGNLFIADLFNNRIRKVDTNGIITTVAGGGGGVYSTSPMTATQVSLNAPYAVAVDSSNNLYIADMFSACVAKVNASGQIVLLAGTRNSSGYSGDGGVATSAKLANPQGVTVDAAGNVFIADTFNNCVRKVGTNNIITTVAGNGTNGYSGDGGMATNANLSTPQNVSVDNIGNLFIADYGNNRVRRVGTNGVITTVAGRVLNDGEVATNATLNSAAGIAFDPLGNLYIADRLNNRVRKVDTNGIITTAAGTGLSGYSGDGGMATNAMLKQPWGVGCDTAGNLFIADTLNYRVRKVGTNGIISTVAGTGTRGGSGNGDFGAATNAKLTRVFAMAVDPIGNCFINEEDRIRKVATNGIITSSVSFGVVFDYGVVSDSAGNIFFAETYYNNVRKLNSSLVAGNGVAGFSGDGGAATSASLNSPRGLAIDKSRNLFIADSFNNRIRKVNTNGIITTIAGTGIAGCSGDGGPANIAIIANPFGMALDVGGSLYFVDSINRVRKLSYLENADQPFFTLTNVSLDSVSNNYSVIITSASGSVTSSVVAVNLQLPPITPVFTASNSVCTFTWSAVSNQTYQLQSTTNLVPPNWIDLGSPITATNNSASAADVVGPDELRFYRVRLWP